MIYFHLESPNVLGIESLPTAYDERIEREMVDMNP